MRRNDKYAILYLAFLLPLNVAAIAWAVGGLPSEKVDLALIGFSLILVCAAVQMRIQLPKTNLQLSLADAVILFSLIYFGGELAIVLSAAATLTRAIISDREPRKSLIGWLVDGGISILTVSVTALVVLEVFGRPQAVMAGRDAISFVLLVALTALLPFVLNTLLTSAYLVIEREEKYWHSLRTHGIDVLLVCLGAAIMAGLAVMALRETNQQNIDPVGS